MDLYRQMVIKSTDYYYILTKLADQNYAVLYNKEQRRSRCVWISSSCFFCHFFIFEVTVYLRW